MDPGNTQFQSYNGMLFGTDDAGEPTNLLLVPEGMEGIAVLPVGLATVPACALSRCLKLSAVQISGSTGASALEGTSFTTRDGILYKYDNSNETDEDESESLTLVAAPAGIGASVRIAPECKTIAEGAFWGNSDLRTIVASGMVDAIEVNPVFDPEARTSESATVTGATEGAIATTEGDTPTAPVPAFMPQVIKEATVAIGSDDARGTWEAAGFTHFAQPAQPGAMTGPAWGNSGLAYTLLDDYTLSVRWKGDGEAPAELTIPATAAIDNVEYTVSTIEDEAFKDQTELSEISFPESITSIGERAFANCTALFHIDIPGSVTVIPASTFEDCVALSEIGLYEGLRSVGNAAFRNTAAVSIVVPASVASIEDAAFADCADLASIVALGSVDEVASTALQGNTNVDIYVPYREDEAYSWPVGAPAAGNHLLPYGIRMAATSITLEVDQTADLFADGIVLAPGDMEVQYSYNAQCASVDADGIVTAKRPGQTMVTASICLDDRILAKAIRMAIIVHANTQLKSNEETAEDSVSEIDEAEEGNFSGKELSSKEEIVDVSPSIIDITASLNTSNNEDKPDHYPIISGECSVGEYEKEEGEFVEENEIGRKDGNPTIITKEYRISESDNADGAEHRFEENEVKDKIEPSESGNEDDKALSNGSIFQVGTAITSHLNSICGGIVGDIVLTDDNDHIERSINERTISPESSLSELSVGPDSSLVQDYPSLDFKEWRSFNEEQEQDIDGVETTEDGFEVSASAMESIISAVAEVRAASYTTITWSSGSHGSYTINCYPYAINSSTGKNQTDWSRCITSGPFVGSYSAPSRISSSGCGTVQSDLSGAHNTKGVLHIYTDLVYPYDNTTLTTEKGRYRWTIKIAPYSGYSFAGWSGTTDNTWTDGDVYGYGMIENGSYTATYSPITYSFTYEPNGGTFAGLSANQNWTTTFNIESNGISTPSSPTRDGYRFLGYKYYGDINGNGFNDDQIHNWNFPGTGWFGNARAVAQWEPIQYALTFNPNGGTWDDGTSGTKTVYFTIETDGISLPNHPNWAGKWDYVGWVWTGDLVTSGKGSGIIDFIEGVPRYSNFLGGTGWWGNATLTAAWRCTITIDCSKPSSSPSGTNNAQQYIYYYSYNSSTKYFSKTAQNGVELANIAKLTVSKSSQWITSLPTADAYTLSGFYEKDKTTASLRITNTGYFYQTGTIAGHVVWEARWGDITYTITLDPAGGTMPSGKSTTIKYTKGQANVPFYSQASTDAGYNPKRTGAEFVGWKCISYDSTITDSWATSGKPYLGFYTGISQYGNYALQAVWRIDITLDGNAPSSPNATTVTMGNKMIYYYPGYGFRSSIAATASSWPTSGFVHISFGAILGAFPTCSDAGWAFEGYHTSKLSTNSSTSPNAINNDGMTCGVTPTSHTTWYAAWQGKAYSINLNPGPSGATQSGRTEVVVRYGMYPPDCVSTGGAGEMEAVCIPIPTFSGWTFDGYYLGSTRYYRTNTNSGHSGHLYSEKIWDIQGGATLTAKWTRSITLNLNDGVSSGSTTITATYGQQLPASLTAAQKPQSPTGMPAGVSWDFYGYYDTKIGSTCYYDSAGSRQYNTAITSTSPSTIYAKWERWVEIDRNDGGGIVNDFQVIKGVTPPNITGFKYERPGYDHVGYYSSSSGGTKYYNANGTRYQGTSTTLPAVIFVHWQAISYPITWNYSTGTKASGVTYPTSYTIETGLDLSTDMDAVPPNGYRFTGWRMTGECNDAWCNDNETHVAEPGFISVGRYGSVTITADYEAIAYQITWDFGAGSQASGTTYPSTYTVQTGLAIATTMNAVPPRGYAFQGWRMTGDCNDVWCNDGKTHSASANFISKGKWGSATITAVYSEITYTVTYHCGACDAEISTSCRHIKNVNGIKTFKVSDLDHASNHLYVEPPTTPSYYRFDGWRRDSGSVSIEGNGPSRLYITDVGDVVCTMNINEVYYDLTLDPGEGGWDANTPNLSRFDVEDDGRAWTSYCVDDAAFQLPAPKWAGHTFAGWNRGTTAVSTTFTPGTTASGVDYGNITYTAVWSTNPYQITYELGDDRGADYGAGVIPADAPMSYNWDSAAVTLPIPTRVGYDFIGWTETIVDDVPPSGLEGQVPAATITGNDPQIDVTIPTHSWGHRTYKAHWRAHEYDIAFDTTPGAWANPQPDVPITATFDEDVDLPKAPKRARYLFKCWHITYTDVDGAEVEADFAADEHLVRPNFISVVGTRADEAPASRGTVTFSAIWIPNLNVDVPVGSEGVHMGLSLKSGNGADPFAPDESELGHATIENRSDGALKIVSVKANPNADYDALKANALNIFADEAALAKASFTVTPVVKSGEVQVARFGIADSTGELRPDDIPDDQKILYEDWTNDEYGLHARGWWILPYYNDWDTHSLDLIYTLDMKTTPKGVELGVRDRLMPEDVNLPAAASLQVADIVYTFELLTP